MSSSSAKRSFAPRASVMGLILLFVLFAVALWAVACGESTPATSTSGSAVVATTTKTTAGASVSTTLTTETEVTETEVTEAEGTETSVASGSSVRTLGENDSGREVVLRVGDRVRIELQPYVNDRVKSVKWNYLPIIVQEVDSGADVVSDVVVECWLELEAVIAGPVTVRGEYEYPYGTRQTAWVGFLIVRE